MEDKYKDLIALIVAMKRSYELKDLGYRKYLGLKWILKNENLLKDYYEDNKEKTLPDILKFFLLDYEEEVTENVAESIIEALELTINALGIDEALELTINALVDGFEAEGFE